MRVLDASDKNSEAVKNAGKPINEDIAARDSRVRVLVIGAQEEWSIIKECWKFAA